ncbi:hypothetical protein [Marinomonas shanghaiensis]|uniref:hypothetical protein n=1 Tax=Marinomonas shanghaiensis TaxID=2202418 RepID=UPI000DBABC57|nr:hypothetical protein [Marinomonas shanghaiensis]
MSILNKYPEGFCIPNSQVSFDTYRHIMNLAKVGGAAQRESEGATMFNYKAHAYFGVNMDGRLWHSHHKGDFSNNLLSDAEIAELIKTEIPSKYDQYGLDYDDLEKLLDAMLFLGISPGYESKEEAMHNQRRLILDTLRGVKKLGPIMDAANVEYETHKKQNTIMKEALMEIRNRGRHWPDAGDIAKNALDKAKEQGE